ncbi:MAG: hypothetical protein EXS16_02405 [Gemmataceae bacterium]|nr:hypothetical protein [Gemmataceae bacterium]
MNWPRRFLGAFLAALACIQSLHADDVVLPPTIPNAPPSADAANNGVLLPPEYPDAKRPNTDRNRTGEWAIHAGVYFFHPAFNTNPAFVINRGAGSQQVDFGASLDAAPMVRIDYTSERGRGARARWFHFDRTYAASQTAASGETVGGASTLALGMTPVAGTITARGNLSTSVVDLQATRTWDGPRWTHVLGGGVRYTYLNLDYQATLAGPGPAVNLSNGHSYHGAGPSISFDTKRRLGESGFAIYGQVYASVLFGRQSEYQTANNGTTFQQFSSSQFQVLPVGEFEFGAEYQRDIGKSKLFLQAGFHGQVWWGTGNMSNIDMAGSGSASNTNMGLIGIALRAGVRF